MALQELAAITEREAGLSVSVRVEGAGEPESETIRTALYRAAKEGLTNVRKHAGASSVEIVLASTPARWSVTVRDDGDGVDGAPGLGLTTMRERFEALGGRVEVTRVGRGTELEAWVPVAEVPAR